MCSALLVSLAVFPVACASQSSSEEDGGPDAAYPQPDASGSNVRDAASDRRELTDGGATDGTTGGSDDGGELVDASVSCPICTYPGSAAPAGTLASAALTELSGLAASQTLADVFYAHNDSGDSARLFRVGYDGSDKGQVTVTGASAVDWEDIAVGPCGAQSCVYIADIGDNLKVRNDLVLYRFVEPSLAASTVRADAYPLSYPDGAHDAEAMFVDQTGVVYIISKEQAGPVGVYAVGPLPATPGPVVARKVGSFLPPTLGFPSVTGADYIGGPCPRAVVRTYAGVLLFEGAPGDNGEAVLKKSFRTLAVPVERQGEAIAFSRDGRAIYSASEGANVPLNRIACGP
jgi:hypothetical protein